MAAYGFASAEDVVEQFWQAYPHGPDDMFLIHFVIDIAGTEGSTETGTADDLHDGPTR